LGISTTGYQFFTFKNASWEVLQDKNLGAHPFPANIQLLLKMHDKEIPLDGKPTIIISESGDITPFVILIAKKGEKPHYQVKGTANGKIESMVAHE
jgi:hypothetical protein